MWPSFLSILGAAVLTAGQMSGPTHTWIADVKANRGTLAGQEVRIEGEVVDVRSTSPNARRGFYRLTDASDPTGVLVRTERIPIDGGSFRLRAKVAADQSVDGTLLLDEVERDRVDARPIVPVVTVLASGLVLAILLVLLQRAVANERRHAVSPPLWLMPDAGPYGKAVAVGGTVQPALKYEPELEEADRVQRDQLSRRKRGLLQALIGSLAVTGASAAWVINTKPVEGQVPAFIFIDSNDPESRASRQRIAGDDIAFFEHDVSVPTDSRPAAPSPVIRTDSVPRRGAPAGAARSTVPSQRSGSLEPAAAPAEKIPARDSTRRAEVVTPEPLPAPPPAPSPVPPPPPPPPPPEAVAPVRDPAVDRARAQSVIQAAAARLLAAINARRSGDVAMLVPEAMAGDLGRRERFLKLVKDFGPKASLGSVDDPTMGDDRGEARISISLAWRGDFGVDKKKSGRLVAFVRRDGETWRFEGARLVDAIP